MDPIQRGLGVLGFVVITMVAGLLPGLQADARAAGGEIVAFTAGSGGVFWQLLVPYEHGVFALDRLSPIRFAYTADPAEQHVGFIAEDVPVLVATKDRTTPSAMDIVAVLTRVVQEQQRAIAALTAEVAGLRSTAETARTGERGGSGR